VFEHKTLATLLFLFAALTLSLFLGRMYSLSGLAGDRDPPWHEGSASIREEGEE